MTLLFTTMAILMAQHGGHHGGHGQGHPDGGSRKHGNPDDLAGYIAKMEDPERDAWQKPNEVVARLGLKKDSVVCDIGAGPGYFSLRIAAQAKQVFAVDVEAKMLSALVERIARSGARNVTPVLALPDDPLIPAGTCDVVLVVDTFHHFPDGVAYLRKLAKTLRPGGRLVNIDFHKRDLPVGPGIPHKVSREDFLAVGKAAGLKLTGEHTDLPYQYFLVLQPVR